MKIRGKIWSFFLLLTCCTTAFFNNGCKKEDKPIFIPTITTSQASEITQTTARSGGILTNDANNPVKRYGVTWYKSNNLDVVDSVSSNDLTVKNFSFRTTLLSPNTTYHAVAWAKTLKGIEYGNIVEFTTLENTLPTVTTLPADVIGAHYAKLGGVITNIESTGYCEESGFCWGEKPNPTKENTTYGTSIINNEFSTLITYFKANTKYYVRAYARNRIGINYGENVEFTTPATSLPYVTLFENLKPWVYSDSVVYMARVDNNESPTLEQGLCWSRNHLPTINDSKVAATNLTSGFKVTIKGLIPETKYYIRAYATNGVGTAYNSEIEITTLPKKSQQKRK